MSGRGERAVRLVALDWSRTKDPRVPLGHASLVAALRRVPGILLSHRAHDITQPGFTLDDVLAEIEAWDRNHAHRSRDLALGVYVWNEHLVQELLRRMRDGGFAGRILLGGPQISYCPPGVDRLYPGADGFVRGYGEEVLARVVASADPVAAPGVVWRGDADAPGQALAELARLPSPLLTGVVPAEGQPYLRWETQRGCPYRCTFCQHREPGSRLRNARFSVDRLREEIALFARSGTREIDVLDPIFNVGPDYLGLLEEMARQRLRARLSLQCRLELVTAEFLEACRPLDVRPEFGLQTIHDRESELIKRRNQMSKVSAVLDDLGTRGVTCMVTLIYGLPEQTLESFKQSVEFCLAHRVPVIRAFPLNLLRGTELERERARWGMVESSDRIPVVLRSNSFDEADWRQMKRIADALAATEGRHPRSLGDLECLARSGPE